MIGKTVLHYTILEEIGRGGMGVVYKAQDLKLDRIVALKFLPLHLTAQETERARFLQEARSASALNHAHVCVIHDIEEADGQQFIVMEYISGTTLRDRIAAAPGGLPVDQAIGFGIQIGEALKEAHQKGIVHRDVKAENIMATTGGQIKVMDFGLAKLKGSLKLTRTSSTVGTLAYMAPEQLQGGEVDARSDIFSFGSVLFEMLTGHTPFRGEHEAAMMYSILNETPLSLQQYRNDCPADLDRIIQRALEKDPEDRYQHVDDMVSELRRLQKQTTRVVRPAQQREQGTVPSATQQVLQSMGATKPATAGRLWRYLVIGGAVILIAAAVVFLLVPRQKEAITSMAVLPFVNVSGDSNVEYLSDGFTEGLINTLSKLPGIKMMSSRSVFKFKGKDIDPQKAAQELHVGAVLMGRILQKGDELSISAELINAQDNSHIWGNQYNRKATDLITVQATISREISDQLKVAMTGDQEKRFAALPTQNVEAYQLFLRGRFSLNKRSEEGFGKAIGYFRSAIDLDPSFALAFAGLSQTYVLRGSYFLLPVEKAIDSARATAAKALELDPSLGEAHTALASISEWAWDWSGAEREYRKAIELSPNFATAHQWFGEFLGFMGRVEEGLVEIRKAQELDPLAPITSTAVAINLVFIRRYNEARQQAEKALEIEPHFPRGFNTLAVIDLAEHKYADAIRESERAVAESDSSIEYLSFLGYAYGVVGRKVDAGNILVRMHQLSQTQYVSPALYALVYGGMGNNDRAFYWLDKALETHDPALEYLNVDPAFDPLRADKRFTELVKKVGLPQ